MLAGCWSPTRPAVIVVTHADGSVHFWDVLDQSHRPTVVMSVSSQPITSVRFCAAHASNTGAPANTQLLAVGDAQGDLHILEIPRALRRPLAGEVELMARFYERELARVHFYRALPPMPRVEQPSGGGGGGGGGKSKRGGDDEGESKEEAERSAERADAEKAEADYQRQLLKFQQELGLVKAGKEDE